MSITVEWQAKALIDEIDREVATQCQAQQRGAEAEAQVLRQRARAKARARLRRAIQDLRTAQRVRTQQVRAEIETAGRRQARARAQRTLALAWPGLTAAIERRWNEPAARAEWIAAQLAVAGARLPAQGWVVRHPANWREPDVTALRSALRVQGVSGATLRADAAVPAGLVIEVGGVRLDSTPAALLAARPRVEAALLALFEPSAAAGAAP